MQFNCVAQTPERWTIQLFYSNRLYVFRYAYESEAEAREVARTLEIHFGQPAGVQAELANNYWSIDRHTQLQFTRNTRRSRLRKGVHYISNPAGPGPSALPQKGE